MFFVWRWKIKKQIVHAYGGWYYMVMNPVDRIHTFWIRSDPDPDIVVSGQIRIPPDPDKTPDILPDPDPDPVHLYKLSRCQVDCKPLSHVMS